MRIPSGVTDQYIYFVAVDPTDFATRETGLTTFTVYRSRNGAAAAAYTTPTVTEVDATNMPGLYKMLVDEDMTIGAGNDSEEIALHITHASMAPVTRTIELYRPKITVGETLAITSGAVDTVTTNTDMRGTDSAATAANLAIVDGIVDNILIDTGTSIPAGIAALNDIAATDIVSAGAITTLAGAVVNVDLVDTVTTNTDMRGTDSAATAAALAVVDGIVDNILVDTGTTIPAAITGLNDLSAADVNAEVDTALADIHLDHLLAVDYDPATKPGTATALLNELVENDAGVSRFTINALENAPSGSGASASAIADAVWTEALADHSGTVGSTAEALDGAGGGGTGLTAAETRAAIGLASANLDAQLSTIDTVVDGIQTDLSNATDGLGAIKADTAAIALDTNELQGDNVPGLIAALNDVAATDIVSAGAITTLAGAVVNVDLVDTVTTNTDMRGTDGANTTTPPTAVAIRSEVDTNSTQLAAIALDTNELQGDNVPGLIAAVQANTDNIQTRLPAALVSGRMDSNVSAIDDAAEAATDLAASAKTIVTGAAATGTLSTTQMTTDLAEATNDHYNGRIIIWTSGVLKDQATNITGYTGTGGLLTYTAVTEAPSNADTFVIV